MGRITVQKYSQVHFDAWNSFIRGSKNGTFLFDRRYMEYHSDRFDDYSLLFFDECACLIAVLPASVKEGVVSSHGGLTYGGIVSDSSMKTATMLEVFAALLAYLQDECVQRLVYKAIPHVFHTIPAEEDLYALFVNDARLFRRDISSVIYLPERLKFSKGKREGVRKAHKIGLEVRDSNDFEAFFAIGNQVMQDRHNVLPVHSSEEMALLAGRFPHSIRLHASFRGDEMLAGALVYVFPTAAHVQYMYNSDEGLELGALDIVLDQLVKHRYSAYRFLSYGISTEQEGRSLNQGLVHQKEMFGARGVVHDFYSIDLG